MSVLRIVIYVLALGGSLLCFINFKRLPRAFFWIGIYLAFAGITQITGYLMVLHSMTNISFYNTTIIPYVLFIYLIYYHLTYAESNRIWMLLVFAVAFILVCVSTYISIQIGEFSIRALLICSLAAVIGALIGLFRKIKNPMHSSPLKMGWLWILMGFLFYYSSTFSYWMAYNFTIDMFNQHVLRFINVILVVIFYIFLLAAIIIQLKFGELNNGLKSQKNFKSTRFSK